MTYTLITGASGGIGAELARLAAKDGHDLILVARSEDKLKELAKELSNVNVIILTADLAQHGAAQRLSEELSSRGLEVDTLINNAGFGDFGPFVKSELSKQQQMLQLNITTLMELTRLLLPAMVERGNGRIMNVASLAAFMPGPGMSVYYATKAFVLSFSEALHEELRGSGVTVTALCPGPVKTGFQHGAALTGHDTPVTRATVSAESVAAYGWQKVKRGTAIAIPRLEWKLLPFILRLLPRTVIRRAVGRVQKS